jgi:glyoxylase-like metal-dependent hydrolase (beta-lactamase superfamily II)
MHELPNGAFQLDNSRGANGYVIPLDRGFAVVDPGMKSGARAVVAEVARAGLTGAVTDVLLTHYDVDHAGAALAVAAENGAKLWIGRADADILAGRRSPGTFARRVLSSMGRPKLPGIVHFLGETEGFPGEIRAVPTPGHTPGHFAFVWRQTVFSGDAAMVRADGTLRQFPALLITDKAQALASTAVLEDLDVQWICPGHGRPVQR